MGAFSKHKLGKIGDSLACLNWRLFIACLRDSARQSMAFGDDMWRENIINSEKDVADLKVSQNDCGWPAR